MLRYIAKPVEKNTLKGTLQQTSKGFAFVLPEHDDGQGDVFVSQSGLHGAMNNDKVEVAVCGRRSGGHREGEIINILEHANTRIVGTLYTTRDRGYVVPDDVKLGQIIDIPVDKLLNGKTGQKVVVEIIKWPEIERNARGRVTEVLGNPDDFGVDILSIIRSHKLPDDFPPQVMELAAKLPREVRVRDCEGRRDLRELSLVTIDGEDAKDLDDAVYVERQGENFLLTVAIADVSSYVHDHSLLDKEANERGTSVYLVDRVIPMLPVELSNGICSLNEGVDRLSLVCSMLINPAGRNLAYEIFPAVIRVRHRLSYNIVRQILVDGDAELKTKFADIVPMLGEMEELCLILKKKREVRGAIDFDFPEQKVILDGNNHPIEVKSLVRSIAECIIEEFMLAANETVAEHMTRANWPFIYRVHDKPEEGKLQALAKLLANFQVPLIIDKNDIQPLAIQKALAGIKGKPEEKMVATVALRSLRQAMYDVDNVGHFGLAAQYYTHFTSPIRRYPDLIVHRLLHSWLKNSTLSEDARTEMTERLNRIAVHSSLKEREAAEAEQETVDLKLAEYMQGFIGEEYDGHISGVTSFGFFVALDNGVEGLVHINSLLDDYYTYLDERFCLVGEHTGRIFRLGDEVRIEVLGVNIAEREIDFVLAGQTAGEKDYIKSRLSGKGAGSSAYDLERKTTRNKKKSSKNIRKVVKLRGKRRRR